MNSTATPRAIKLTSDSIKVITNGGVSFDLPPHIDHLIDLVTTPDVQYYFMTDHPGTNPSRPLSWVLIPDFMFHERFQFAAKESNRQLVSVIAKEQ